MVKNVVRKTLSDEVASCGKPFGEHCRIRAVILNLLTDKSQVRSCTAVNKDKCLTAFVGRRALMYSKGVLLNTSLKLRKKCPFECLAALQMSSDVISSSRC